MAELLFKHESFEIIGICMQIHNILGMGLKEINYKDAMEMEFTEKLIPYQREVKFAVKYKDKFLRNAYCADFVIFENIILEIKSAPAIHAADKAQALSYLAVTGLKLAIIINFGETSLSYKRIVL